ncbi:hypothetical protein ATY76_19610 [Rhizobium sp. R339]|nr:hypothetical protein ATY76_19610 [Rhizobium sp. R339]
MQTFASLSAALRSMAMLQFWFIQRWCASKAAQAVRSLSEGSNINKVRRSGGLLDDLCPTLFIRAMFKVAAAPADGFSIFWIFRVGDDLQEPLITGHATNIFGRSRPFPGDAASLFGRRSEPQELLDCDGVPPAIPEIIVVAKDSTLLEVQQANLSLIEDPRIVIGRILRQGLDVPIPQTTDAEFIEMIVPPVECGLNSEMQVLQVPMDRQDQTAPDVRLDLVDGKQGCAKRSAL